LQLAEVADLVDLLERGLEARPLGLLHELDELRGAALLDEEPCQ
jgi:hypothetical protein